MIRISRGDSFVIVYGKSIDDHNDEALKREVQSFIDASEYSGGLSFIVEEELIQAFALDEIETSEDPDFPEVDDQSDVIL